MEFATNLETSLCVPNLQEGDQISPKELLMYVKLWNISMMDHFESNNILVDAQFSF